MIAADAKLLTYAEAGARLGGRGIKFIREAIRRGDLLGTDLGPHTKRVSELDLLRYIDRCKTTERYTGRGE